MDIVRSSFSFQVFIGFHSIDNRLAKTQLLGTGSLWKENTLFSLAVLERDILILKGFVYAHGTIKQAAY
jgi:hypothetical protein